MTPFIIFMGMQLREMEGLVAMRRRTSKNLYPDPRVFALTARDQSETPSKRTVHRDERGFAETRGHWIRGNSAEFRHKANESGALSRES